jgi:hypothetical protein
MAVQVHIYKQLQNSGIVYLLLLTIKIHIYKNVISFFDALVLYYVHGEYS